MEVIDTLIAPASGYMSLKDFHRVLSKKSETPYEVAFNLMPFIDQLKIQKKEHHQCPQSVNTMMDELRKELRVQSAKDLTEERRKQLEDILSMMFPSLFFKDQMGFVSIPFTKEFIVRSDQMEALFGTDLWEVKMTEDQIHDKVNFTVMEIGSFILNTCYGQEIDLDLSNIFTVRNRETGLEKHYKIHIVLDYVQVKEKKPLRKLSDQQIHELMNQWDNPEPWLTHLPPENFGIEGMVIGYLTDVTKEEVLSQVKEKLAEPMDEEDPDETLAFVNTTTRSYLNMPDVDFGNLQLADLNLLQLISWSLLGNAREMARIDPQLFNEGIYGEVQKRGDSLVIGNLEEYEGILEKRLLKKGYKSLILTPLYDNQNQLVSVVELGCPEAYRFSNATLYQLKGMFTLFTLGTNRWMEDNENKLTRFIQQQFTSIHSSVAWKFSEVAKAYLWEKEYTEEPGALAPIVFDEVYPLYGQADIVGSSYLRNESIREDLITNLTLVKQVMEACRREIEFHLLEVYLDKVASNLKRLEEESFVSSDESQILELLTAEVHPLLEQLASRFPQLASTQVQPYFDHLDKGLKIIYQKRRDYEDSVGKLNEVLSNHLELEDEKMQGILPHFFEKYKTDGIEYNIYLGQSILQNGTFSEFYLKDFRLWQLIQMCEMTRLVQKTAGDLPVPLETAQLVFVYSNPLSIRFRMDEKQFDVDGTYNVRYEILKKRIDKAEVKGTGERLTQAGKIAIVWLLEKDKLEYMDYLKHLIHQNYIQPEIEELALEVVQGAEGLHALRVEVA